LAKISETNIESLLEKVEKPARYIGGEVGSTAKESAKLRVVLSYPDVYEIGTANQAVQILYSLINQMDDVSAERAYCPWPDMAELMRVDDVPLFSLESWEPVSDADLWGITLQHELTYTNFLEMMDLAGVPQLASERGDDDPLVFAGGPCASNPHPVAPFFDFFIIGDGEAVILEVMETIRQGDGASRPEALASIAAIDGIYIPGKTDVVTRAVVTELSAEAMTGRPIVPSMHAIHDRATIEIKRGCTRGCRFCMAGTWYRPVRERNAADICRSAEALVEATGYDEVSLSSLSVTDHSSIKDILTRIAQTQPGVTVSLPSLRVDPESLKLLNLTSSRKGSITLAPEAGSQRMRDVINKQVSGDDIERSITEAFEMGSTTVKLYFMIGLPTETEADLQGIVDIAVAARKIGRQVARSSGRVRINVSIASFVPKAHTPFQWAGMNGRTELEKKQEFLRRNMPRKQIKLSMHDIEPSLVEGAIARGGEETAAAIMAAWKSGARFDAWSERFNLDAWEKGFAAISGTVEQEATRSYSVDEPLPWDDIDSRVTKQFLLDENDRAIKGEITPDCRWDDCTECGVCDGEIDMRIEQQ
jgi:radical SAM superfamily enzyme YgiQ (UPF0313 family)